MIDTYEFRQKIYDLVNGYIDLSKDAIPESAFVTDEFATGSFCSSSYGKVLDAYSRLCKRLNAGNGEDEDVEIIIDELNSIMHHISLKMFAYGVFFARQEKNPAP